MVETMLQQSFMANTLPFQEHLFPGNIGTKGPEGDSAKRDLTVVAGMKNTTQRR